MRRHTKTILAQCALLVGVLGLLGNGDIRADELECEHAIAHLQDCCPAFTVGERACDYSDGCGTTTWPLLDEDQAECVQDLDCAAILERSMCERVMGLVQPQWDDETGQWIGSDAGSRPQRACP